MVGTDVFHAGILLWAASIAHTIAGNVDFGLAGNILIGSVPGVWVGSRWSVRVPVGALRPALAVLLIGAGLALLAKADVVAVPTAVLAAFPVGVGILFGTAVLRRRAAGARAGRSLAAPARPPA